MNSQLKNGIIIGLALFAMFFGAGNLIFPTSVGLLAGDQWKAAMLGFLATGVGLPLLGIFAIIKMGGTLSNFSSKLGKFASTAYGMTIITSLALVAVSRTAATTFEMSISPLLPNASPIISSIIFFSITLLLVFNPSGIIDRIGKILTPVLLIMLSIIIIKGIIIPIGNPINIIDSTQFSKGFFGGYQTMDALGSVMLGGIITASLLEKGYSDKKSQMKVAIIAIIVAGVGLASVYGGLLFLGSTSSSILSPDLSRTNLTISIVQLVLGETGKIVLGLCVAFACLTTSIGVTATVGDYYENLTKGKIKYKLIVTITCILCAIISNIGVEAIITIATPLLIMIYPVTIVLIGINLFSKESLSHYSVKGAVFGALSISIFDGLKAVNISFESIDKIISYIPLASQNFAWITPAILGFILGLIIHSYKSTNFKNNSRNQRPLKAS